MKSALSVLVPAFACLSFASIPASAQDAAAGEKLFNQCRTCHQIGETARNGVGPQLNGLFGRKAGSIENYNYSAVYKTLDKVWDPENFTVYIKDPRGVTPGTKMVYPGMKDETQITNLVAYLKQFSADGKKAPPEGILTGKVLIYGGGGGIGAATARMLRKRGYTLHLAGRDEARLAVVAEETGGAYTVADVEDAAAFARIMAEAGASLAGLVYAAGTINLKPLGRLTIADFERDFRINAMGAALAVQAALPALKAHDGTASIVLFSTVAVAQGFTAHASVAMAKGAVEGLTLALAAELAPKVRVNAIAPSLTRTPLAKALTSSEPMANAIAQMHAIPRLGPKADHLAEDAQEGGLAQQGLRNLQVAVRVAQEMGKGEDKDGEQQDMTHAIRLVLGDQLTRSVSSLNGLDKANDSVLIVEVHDEATYVRHHKQKIAFLFSAMRHFAQDLRREGVNVDYVRLNDPANTGSFTGELERAILRHKATEVFVTEPGEWRVWEMMLDWRERFDIPVHIREDDRFLCSRDAFAHWAEGRKQFRMEFFYREMRRETGLLMDGEEPEGGQWNYDHDNRKRLPANFQPPSRLRFEPDAETRTVLDLVSARFGNHFGDLEPFGWAVTREDALLALDHFIAICLGSFGDYQDAMKTGEDFLSHSVISPYLNAGLLTAREVADAAEVAYRKGKAPLNAVEGFIRQVIGWREFVRGIYWTRMPAYAATNHLGARRKLPAFFWTGETDMHCLSEAIRATRQHAYAHHIQRLMITGNFALLAGIAPHEVEEWYLVVYADAYEWVELPNVHGMALHADGGILGSKPYAASGAYIDRMSDYCRSCAYDPAIKSGPKACPFNYLYWGFLIENETTLAKNPRMAMPYRTLTKMTEVRKREIAAETTAFLDGLEARNTAAPTSSSGLPQRLDGVRAFTQPSKAGSLISAWFMSDRRFVGDVEDGFAGLMASRAQCRCSFRDSRSIRAVDDHRGACFRQPLRHGLTEATG
eukprot:gene17465-23018_t